MQGKKRLRQKRNTRGEMGRNYVSYASFHPPSMGGEGQKVSGLGRSEDGYRRGGRRPTNVMSISFFVIGSYKRLHLLQLSKAEMLAFCTFLVGRKENFPLLPCLGAKNEGKLYRDERTMKGLSSSSDERTPRRKCQLFPYIKLSPPPFFVLQTPKPKSTPARICTSSRALVCASPAPCARPPRRPPSSGGTSTDTCSTTRRRRPPSPSGSRGERPWSPPRPCPSTGVPKRR